MSECGEGFVSLKSGQSPLIGLDELRLAQIGSRQPDQQAPHEMSGILATTSSFRFPAIQYYPTSLSDNAALVERR